MKDYGIFGIVAALVVILFVSISATFTVEQTEQALVLRFGEPVEGRGLVTEPGLHFKIPLIENVITRSNQILNLESPNQEVLASDNTRIQVDAFLRYRIVDLLKFYQSVQTVDRANSQLGYVLNSAIRRVLGEANLTQIVRDDRASLMEKIRVEVNAQSERLGIDAVDVRIRRADLPQQISEQVYQRMNSERAREAAEYRAKGNEESQTIKAKADRDVVVLLGNAQQQADQTRGEGEATRNKIFADAYGKDPDFFAFYRLMDAYGEALKGPGTRLVLSPGTANEFFRFFKSPTASSPVVPKPPETPGQPQASR
jgi:membrane protease subunit HflC